METLFAQLTEIASQVLADWRMWFVHVCTWILIHKVKVLWDHLRPSKRRRITELVSATVAASFTLWAFHGEPYAFKLAVAMGLANTYLYKFMVGAMGHYRPEWVRWLRPKKYDVKVVDPDEVEGTGDTVFLVREDGEKTIRVSKKELSTLRGTRSELESSPTTDK